MSETNRLVTVFSLTILIISSCTPYKSLINYSQTENFPEGVRKIENFQPIRIQANDLLSINVHSLDKETSDIFNGGSGEYLVGNDGTINVPFIGSVLVEGLTINEAKGLLQNKVAPYFVLLPIVNIYLRNFTIQVHGEVGRPGTIRVSNDRISLLDALILAGDFTLYSSREDILLIREEGDSRSFHVLDFSSIEIMNSPLFYLQQNDVIYVKPKKRKSATVIGTSNEILKYGQFTLSVALFLSFVFNFR